LLFRGHGVFYALENLMEDQDHRPPMRSVPLKNARLMFIDTLLQTVARCSDVIRAVDTPQDVHIGTQIAAWISSMRPSRRPLCGLLRMRRVLNAMGG
jgi:hypothetical protein